MIKKIIGLLMILTLILEMSSGIVYAETDINVSPFEGEFVLVKKLGIVKDTESAPFDGEKNITRGEFAVYLAAIAGYSDIKDNSVQAFSDVKKGSPCLYAINMLKSIDVIKGTGDNSFNPDSPLLYRDALTFLIRLLGYEIIAESNGGYPGGYYLTAAQNGIVNGISMGINEIVDGKTLVKLLFNSLNVNLKVQASYGNKGALNLKNGETLLSSVFNVYKQTGVVNANEYTGLGSVKDAVSENCVVIDKYIYSCKDSDISDKLGMKVNFYYEDKLEDGSLSEILYYENVNRGDKYYITLQAEKITGAANYKINYEESYGNTKNYSFDGNSYVIFNGIAHPDYSYTDLIPKMGDVTLTDTDGNGIYDVINVTSLVDYTVTSASTAFEKVSVDGHSDFDFKATDKKFEIIREDKKAEPSEVYLNDVITVMESKDGSYVKMYVSTASVTGTVNEVYEENGISYVKIDETVYVLSKTSSYSPVLSDYGSFYLNYRGEISNKSSAETSEKYGYLIKIGSVGVRDKEYKFKILTSRGITVYEPAKKVTLNSHLALEPAVIAAHNELWANGVADADGNPTEQQLIKFKTNTEGQLTHIYTYTDKTASTDRIDKDDTEFAFNAKYATVTYRSGNRALGTKYLVNASTIIFEAPEKASYEDEDFTSYNISRLVHDKDYPGVEFYGVNYENTADAVVMRSASKSASKIPNYLESVIVTKVTKVSENDITGTKIYGVLKGAEVEYKCFDSEVGDYDPEYGNGIMFSELKPGDVVQLSEDSEGYIDQMRLLFRKDGDIGYKLSKTEGINYMNMGLMSSTGKVVGRSPKVIVVNCYDGVTTSWDRTFMKNDKTHFFVFDTAKKKLTEVEPTDIDIGAMVYVRGSYSGLYDLIWYK